MRTISFIIPTIGKSDKLSNLIQSIRNFSKSAQIILVDNSKKGCSDLNFNNFQVDYFHLPEGGVSKSRNFGASKVKNDFVYFLDDDVVPNQGWVKAIKEVLSDQKYENSLIGGSVYVPEDIKQLVPSKYSFLVGEKILGSSDKILHNKYLASCNFIFDTKIFNKLGGFPEEYGHSDGKIILNEEIYLQEKAKKIELKVYYKNNLAITHYWKGDKNGLMDRVGMQGLYDRKIDIKFNKKRFLLRMTKYLIFIPLKFILVCLLSKKDTVYHFDLCKYTSYVGYKIRNIKKTRQ